MRMKEPHSFKIAVLGLIGVVELGVKFEVLLLIVLAAVHSSTRSFRKITTILLLT